MILLMIVMLLLIGTTTTTTSNKTRKSDSDNYDIQAHNIVLLDLNDFSAIF